MGSVALSSNASQSHNFQNDGAANAIAISSGNGMSGTKINVEVLDADLAMRAYEFMDDTRDFVERQAEATREYQAHTFNTSLSVALAAQNEIYKQQSDITQANIVDTYSALQSQQVAYSENLNAANTAQASNLDKIIKVFAGVAGLFAAITLFLGWRAKK